MAEGRESGRAVSGQPAEAGSDSIERRMERCRRRIDECDAKLVELLNARAAQALEIGRLKDVVGMQTYQPQREVAVLAQVRAASRGPLDDGAITRVFERIIDESRRLERLSRTAAEAGGAGDAEKRTPRT